MKKKLEFTNLQTSIFCLCFTIKPQNNGKKVALMGSDKETRKYIVLKIWGPLPLLQNCSILASFMMAACFFTPLNTNPASLWNTHPGDHYRRTWLFVYQVEAMTISVGAHILIRDNNKGQGPLEQGTAIHRWASRLAVDT